MKRLITFLCLMCPLALFANVKDPLLVVSLMIKNEVHSIEDTLEPLVSGGITAYLIFDTGSTDGTLEVVEKFFKKHKQVKAVVKQEPFVDFSTSRNRALDLAKESFPKAEFIFMPDAEWILHDVPGLLAFCEKERDSNLPSYMIRVLGGSLDYYSTRLVRANGPAHYVGKVHEVIIPATAVKAPDTVYLEQRCYEKGLAQSKERWKRDRTILEEAFLENPTDARTLFYLAQTCSCLEDYQSAYQYYLIRSKLKGWPEEDYMTLYRLAEVVEELAKTNQTYLPEMIYYYMEAYNMRPTRAEPLVKIAEHYLRNGKYPLSYLYAEKATKIEYPSGDTLFVDKYMYDFTRYDILSQCAWYVDQKEVGYEALKKAIAYAPDAEYLKANLSFYE